MARRKGTHHRKNDAMGIGSVKSLLISVLVMIISFVGIAKYAPSYAPYSIPAGLAIAGMLEHKKQLTGAAVATAGALFAMPYVNAAIGGSTSSGGGWVG